MSERPSLAELDRICQKIEHRRIGNWFARRVSRPMALHVTWLVAPWGVSAHAVTLMAWSCGVGAAVALSFGSVESWLWGAALLQAWYLLDHVDGQVARYRGTASLDGVHLDYMMHHTMQLLLPLGVAASLCSHPQHRLWLALGAAWAVGALLVNAAYDARYKAFVQRLKLVRGPLEVMGGGGGRPTAPPAIPRHPIRFASWLARKVLEIHVVMNALSVLAVGQWMFADESSFAAKALLSLIGPLATAVGVAGLFRSVSSGAAEREFAAWFQPASGLQLVYRDGWWLVVSDKAVG